jgi:hypothetical protein
VPKQLAEDLHESWFTVAKKRKDELHFTTQIWGASDGVEARLRELTHDVRALRREMASERHVPALPSARLLQRPPPTATKKPARRKGR